MFTVTLLPLKQSTIPEGKHPPKVTYGMTRYYRTMWYFLAKVKVGYRHIRRCYNMVLPGTMF
jgi:hypothetical protein